MKRILKFFPLFILLSLSSVNTKAQGTLQFNRVIHTMWDVVATNTNAYVNNDTTIIVPANKVWKLEGVSASVLRGQGGGFTNILNNGGTDPLMMYLDGVLFYTNPTGSTTSSAFNPGTLWLPAGAHTFTFRNWNAGTNTIAAFINVIEFNILP